MVRERLYAKLIELLRRGDAPEVHPFLTRLRVHWRVHWRVHYGLKNMGYMVYLLTVGASS
jgi:hypothetical protein